MLTDAKFRVLVVLWSLRWLVLTFRSPLPWYLHFRDDADPQLAPDALRPKA
jgi:hypothetical protein